MSSDKVSAYGQKRPPNAKLPVIGAVSGPKVPEGEGFFAPTEPVSADQAERLFSETDISILIMTISGVIGTILGFVFGLLAGHATV